MNRGNYLTCLYLDVLVSAKEQMFLWDSGESAPQVTWSACCTLRRENKEKIRVYSFNGFISFHF